MLPAGFEPTISAGERPQTYALDRAVTGTGVNKGIFLQIMVFQPSEVTIGFVVIGGSQDQRECK